MIFSIICEKNAEIGVVSRNMEIQTGKKHPQILAVVNLLRQSENVGVASTEFTIIKQSVIGNGRLGSMAFTRALHRSSALMKQPR